MTNSRIILFSLVLFAFFESFGQTVISGNISNKDKDILSYANILLKDTKTNSIIHYTFSDEKGNYVMEVNRKGEFNLTFSLLGYKSKTIPVVIDNTRKKINIDVILVESPLELDEVTIQAEAKMSVKKDTVTFKTKYFMKGTEQTVEDMLQSIPGVNVNADGTIKIGNREIEKLMIDGDDFFGKGYKVLSKNMPAYPVEEVEILQNYSNNRLLKGIEESDKVALNLKLNEKSKRIWFGNINLGYDISLNNRYRISSNLMNFGKKNKYYFLTNLNNIGDDATGDIDYLIRSFRIGQSTDIGDNQQARILMDLSSTSLRFKKSRTNFNNEKLVSLNAIFNPTDRLKIKTLGFLNRNKKDFFRNAVEHVTAYETSFTNTEKYKSSDKEIVGFGKLDFIYNISKTAMLESTTKYNTGNKNGQSDLVYNGTSTIENLQSDNTLFDQKIRYTNKFKDNKVFILTGRYIDEKTPQSYSVNRFFFPDLFPDYTNTDNVRQRSENQMQFAGFEARFFDRKTNGNLLEFQFGDSFRKDQLNTTFTLFENSTILETPDGFQNNTTFQTNDLYCKTKYQHKIKNFAITGRLGFHQLFNKLIFDNSPANQRPFFVNPGIGVNWKINDKNIITSSYSYNTTNAKILDVYNAYALTNYHSFSKGTGNFNQLNAFGFLFNYRLGKWSDRFFANASLIYNKNFDFFSSNTVINQNFTQSEKILIKDRALVSVSSKFDYYIDKISSNLKLDVSYLKSNHKNIINNSNVREVVTYNYSYGLELRSGFKGVFNFHLGTKWKTNEINTPTINNSYTDNLTFLDLSFVFNEKFNVQFQTERYFFGNLDQANNTYYFLDADARYTIKKNKITIALTGKNLFNTETFRTFSISDIMTSTTEYRLLERFVLLKLEYRF